MLLENTITRRGTTLAESSRVEKPDLAGMVRAEKREIRDE